MTVSLFNVILGFDRVNLGLYAGTLICQASMVFYVSSFLPLRRLVSQKRPRLELMTFH